MTDVADRDAEREIDLAALARSLVALWWVVAAGLVGGFALGALYSLGGGSVYIATARIAPGQAFNPNGSAPVLTYLTNQTAINEIATSQNALEVGAAAAGISDARLRGNVTTKAVSQTTTGATASPRNAVLVDITVRLSKKKQAEDAADAIASYVRKTTISPYVRKSIGIYGTRIQGFQKRLLTLQQRVDVLTQALKQKGLSLTDRLLLAIQLDQAQANQGQTIDSLSTTQQEQLLAQVVEQTQIILDAKGQKSTARSRRTSIAVGSLIGLIIGVAAAIVLDRRWTRAPRV